MRKIYLQWTALFMLVPFALFSQDGQLDASFGEYGYVETDLFGFLDFGFAIAAQSDGNIVAAGVTEIVSNKYVPTLVRYLPDGNLDPAFGSDGIVTTDFNTPIGLDSYYDVYIQEDQKIVAAGFFGSPSSHDIMISRYMVDGSLDPSFGSNGITIIDLGDDDRFGGMGVMSDGKILIVGVSKISGANNVTFFRFLPDGNPDTSFGNNGIQVTGLIAPIDGKFILQLLENDSILVSGKLGGGTTLGKFEAEGNLDPDFGDNGLLFLGINSYHAPFSITSEENIVVGLSRSLGNDEREGVLKRYLSNGSIDASFGDNGSVTMSYENFRPRKIIVQTNQQILILGNSAYGIDSNDAVVTRYKTNGNLDTTFGSGGSSSSSEIYGDDMLLQEDGKIVWIGFTQFDINFYLARYLNDPFTFGLQDHTLNDLTLFPNPSNGKFTIQYDNPSGSEIPFQITDITGKIVQEGKLSGNQASVDLSAARSGVYFLNTASSTLRLIKK